MWRESWQCALSQASEEFGDGGELAELLAIFLSHKDLQIQDKLGRVTIKTLNRHYRRLMIALLKLNEAGEKGEQQIRSFREEFIGWQDPSKLVKEATEHLSHHYTVAVKPPNSCQVKTNEHNTEESTKPRPNSREGSC